MKRPRKAASPLLASLGASVRRHRLERAWTIRELAAASSLSLRFVGDVESGRGNVSLLSLEKLAGALGASIPALLSGPSRPRIVALVGLRGAGKTTVGRALAAKLARPFVELDQLIESAAGLSLAEIFALHGDLFYRRLETATLERFLREDTAGSVLATGGGIVTNSEAFSALKRDTVVVWLKASPTDHWSRVIRQGDRRPMRANPRARAELRALLRAREPLYRQAAHTADTSELGLSGTVESITSALR